MIHRASGHEAHLQHQWEQISHGSKSFCWCMRTTGGWEWLGKGSIGSHNTRSSILVPNPPNLLAFVALRGLGLFLISIFKAAASTAIFAFKLLQYTPCLTFTGILHLYLFWVSCIPFSLTSSSKGVPHLLAGHSHFLPNSKAALRPGLLATYCLRNCVRLGAPAL